MSDVTYTKLSPELCQPVADLVDACFPDMPPEDKYLEEDLLKLIDHFPAGSVVAQVDDRPVGFGTGVFLDLDLDNLPPTENDLLYTDNIFAHDMQGSYYFGTEFCVHPLYRMKGIGRQIYKRRKQIVTEHQKVGFAAVSVLPGYENEKHRMDIDTYIQLVREYTIFDPTLSMQMRNGFSVLRPIKDFFTYPKSDNWGALILWKPE